MPFVKVTDEGLKLSIITININNAAGLRKTIESVAAQTSRNFEYIIIDGGSTDDSVSVIREFTDIPPGSYKFFPGPASSPITYWISEPDTGIYQAMNKGIRAAKGMFCQFLNSGDWLASPDVTGKMMGNLPEKGILIGNMVKVMPDGKVIKDRGSGLSQPTFLTFYRGTLNHSPAYIRRDLFFRYGLYDEVLRIVSDWKWYLQVVGLNNEPVNHIDQVVTCFDMTGISNMNSDLITKERRQVLKDLVPANILADYDLHWRNIDQAVRINRYPLTRFGFWFVERVLFKLEKWGILTTYRD